MSQDRLFTPLKLGDATLQHRVIMAPLTRFRATNAHIPTKCAQDYYEQRAAVPGTLLVTEATLISLRAAGYRNVPGIWNEEQVRAWKGITDVVHARGSFIYVQLWALGRTADHEVLREEGDFEVVSSSPIGFDSSSHTVGVKTVQPRALTKAEIEVFIQDYANAARNAMRAGFDGVELHGANGYLIDQFWQDVVNQRTDEYGGSIENRARFGIDVAKAVIEAVGDSNKVGIRLSPWSNGQGMGMNDPVPQFLHITRRLKELDLAYLHFIERRILGAGGQPDFDAGNHYNDVFVDAWGGSKPILLAGGFTPEKAREVANEKHFSKNVCVVFGRHFISNPDLPFRLQNNLALNEYNRSTFYTYTRQGYTDYAFSDEWIARNEDALSRGLMATA